MQPPMEVKMNVRKIMSTVSNYYSTNAPKEIIVHYTGSANTSAEANAKYLSRSTKSSAHYVVDDKEIIQVVDEKRGAWHSGNKSVNTHSIGIEICCRKTSTKTLNASDKDWYFTDATINNVIELVRDIRKRYGNLPIRRHFDVTGKICPAPWVHSNRLYEEFKNRCNTEEPIEFKPYLVKVNIDDLNIRKGPGTNYSVIKCIEPGVYTIIEENNGWGLLKSKVGWIKLSYTTKIGG